MKNIIKCLGVAIISLVALLTACDRENDFYEVGRQQVFLSLPINDTAWVLNYQKPDSLYTFGWNSKRNFVNYRLVFSLNKDMSEPKKAIDVGVRQSFLLTTMQLDSIMSYMDVGIAESADVYWTIELVDPNDGWCEDVRKLNITRCDLPNNVIMLETPPSLANLILDKSTPEEHIIFTWDCRTNVDNYLLELSFDEDFTNIFSFEKGKNKSHEFTHTYLDNLLADNHVRLGETEAIFWRIKGEGNPNNPIENSAVREISITRFARDPVQIELLSPVKNDDVTLKAEDADDLFKFEWECDTTGVSFKVHLSDKELEHTVVLDAGTNNYFAIKQVDLDLLLEQEFDMVPSQKKIMYWEVVPDDELRAISPGKNNFTIQRFQAVTSAHPIVLTNAPTNGTSYVLNYASAGAVLTNMTWDCASATATYAIEYSLKPDMSEAKTLELSRDKSFSFTHNTFDVMLSDLGGAYLTKTLYWRITSTVKVLTEPSEIRSLSLRGMLRPFVDKRDPNNPETYNVVKIGENFWFAENLRATKYSDGTPFTAVDLPSKTYTAGAIGDRNVIGQFYTWPTALRTWQNATSNDNTIIQGVCPCGWHVSTKKEWDDMITTLGNNPAAKAKSTQYWANKTGITNSSGLGLTPGGIFWHGNVAAPDNAGADGKSGYWTTTIGSATSAYMFEIFDWDSNNIIPWHYSSRPWSEGDGTASRMVFVRCVRTQN